MTPPRARTAPLAGGMSATALGLGLGAAALGLAAFLNDRAARAAEARCPPTGRFVDIDGVAVHYHEAGEGPPVLLLHGNGTSGEDFILSGLFDHLARRHRVIAPDRPGYGYTDRPRDRLWTASAQADLFAGFLGRLGIERPVVLGHSWGTIVALSLAAANESRLAGLVLLSGYYYPSVRLDVALLSPPALPVLGDAMRYTISPVLGRLMAPKLFARIFEPRPVPKRFRRRFPLDLALRPSQLRASAEDTALMIPSAAAVRDSYGALRLPVQILAGDGDRIVEPEGQSTRLAAELAHAEMTLIPGAGHMTHYGNHDRIASAVLSVVR